MTPTVRLALVGAVGWAAATLALRLLPTWPAPSWALAAGVLVLLAALPRLVILLTRQLPREGRIAGAAAIALPGMVGDAAATASFTQVFPQAPAAYAGGFGGLMLLGYAVILATGFASARH